MDFEDLPPEEGSRERARMVRYPHSSHILNSLIVMAYISNLYWQIIIIDNFDGIYHHHFDGQVREYKGQVVSKELQTRKIIYQAVNPQCKSSSQSLSLLENYLPSSQPSV